MVQDTQPVGTVMQLPCWRGQPPVPTVTGFVPGAGPADSCRPLPIKTYLGPGMACLHESIVCSQMVTLPEVAVTLCVEALTVPTLSKEKATRERRSVANLTP